MKLSLIVPCYNEAENVAEFQSAVISAFDGCGYDYEIVFVDDGSKDATLHNLRKLYAKQECPVKVISFSRNFGKEAGIYAGLQHASGDYISLIDADMQQRPELVREMVEILDQEPDYDVVAAYQGQTRKKTYSSAVDWGSTGTMTWIRSSPPPCRTVNFDLFYSLFVGAGHSPSPTNQITNGQEGSVSREDAICENGGSSADFGDLCAVCGGNCC